MNDFLGWETRVLANAATVRGSGEGARGLFQHSPSRGEGGVGGKPRNDRVPRSIRAPNISAPLLRLDGALRRLVDIGQHFVFLGNFTCN